MIKLKKLIKEHAWDRKFGEALPTLSDVAKKHQKTEKGCGCNGHEGACKCEVKEEVVSEGPDEIKRSKKGLLKPNLTITISILKPIEAGLQKEIFLKNLQDIIYSELNILN